MILIAEKPFQLFCYGHYTTERCGVLTLREQNIYRYQQRGMNAREIGEQLDMSASLVHDYFVAIRKKGYECR